jgi:hypothetical protein
LIAFGYLDGVWDGLMVGWDLGTTLIRRLNERHDNHLAVDVYVVESGPLIPEEKFSLPILDPASASILRPYGTWKGEPDDISTIPTSRSHKS